MPALRFALRGLLVLPLLIAAALLVVVAARLTSVKEIDTPIPRRVGVYRDGLVRIGRWFGSRSARNVVVLFADYRCDSCAIVEERVLRLIAGDSSTALVLIHLPQVRRHPGAYGAAIVAECASDDREFLKRHALLTASLSRTEQEEAGRRLNSMRAADTWRRDGCVIDERSRPIVEAHVALAHRLGIRRIPTVLFDGLAFGPEFFPFDSVERLLSRGRRIGE